MKIMKPSRPEIEATQEKSGAPNGRRTFLRRLGLGTVVAGLAGQLFAFVRALTPNVLYEDPKTFKIGTPDSFAQGVTYLQDHRLFVGRDQRGLYAISAVCTHLGCTVKPVNLSQPRTVQVTGKAVEIAQEFHCPCHGSKYYGDGTNYAGPAPRPLDWYRLEVSADDGQVVVNTSAAVKHDFRLNA
jgi:menaquinol-cytochrome c reductase iron-sulfur subunit